MAQPILNISSKYHCHLLRKLFNRGRVQKCFFSLKTNKSPGYDNIHVNVIRNRYNKLKTPLMNIFNLSLNTGIFPDRMKVAKVTPIFKKGEKSSISNYRPISVPPYFSKILEGIMYNRLYD